MGQGPMPAAAPLLLLLLQLMFAAWEKVHFDSLKYRDGS
uniref:Uncharacterized protein n=1 Tax=Oryza sativa subsp. japonica TaxID=39947 RepID=Q2QZW4_ORYSJ|nr:hypothetical protein LOC_Os11g44619 [Oryza sativa Japonica Group]